MKNEILIIFLRVCCTFLLYTAAQETNAYTQRLFQCYNGMMNPSTKKPRFFGYPENFVQEFCINYVMNPSTKFYEDCGGFQIVVTKEAKDGADKIKEIFHEEMDDVEIENKNTEEVGEEELENEGEVYCIYYLYFTIKIVKEIKSIK